MNDIQTINISKDFSSESLKELGKEQPYKRYVDFPVNIIEEVKIEKCAIDAFFENERKAGRNTAVAMISCQCSKCSIYKF